jgi:hypothetical protein
MAAGHTSVARFPAIFPPHSPAICPATCFHCLSTVRARENSLSQLSRRPLGAKHVAAARVRHHCAADTAWRIPTAPTEHAAILKRHIHFSFRSFEVQKPTVDHTIPSLHCFLALFPSPFCFISCVVFPLSFCTCLFYLVIDTLVRRQ